MTTAQEPKVEKFAIPVDEAKELMSTPTTTTQPSSPEISSETILALKAAPPILSIKECGEKITDNKSKAEKEEEQQQPPPAGSESDDEPKTPAPGEIIPLGFPPAEAQSLPSDPENLVPIQVAELVLQADIKESVSEDTSPVSEEIISSIPDVPAVIPSPPVRTTDSEAPIPTPEMIAEPTEKLEIKTDAKIKTPTADKSTSETVDEEIKPTVPEESPQVPEIVAAIAQPISTDEKNKPTTNIKTQVPDSPQETVKVQASVESTETKDIKIPATPTVIEATPPTSPQFETTEDEITAPKKTARKVVKKVVKKPKESQDEEEAAAAAEGTSEEKPKKTVKVVKKTTELNENLEPDTFAPETPPPTTMNPPTPPKRKSKTSITKTTTKKSESEK